MTTSIADIHAAIDLETAKMERRPRSFTGARDWDIRLAAAAAERLGLPSRGLHQRAAQVIFFGGVRRPNIVRVVDRLVNGA